MTERCNICLTILDEHGECWECNANPKIGNGAICAECPTPLPPGRMTYCCTQCARRAQNRRYQQGLGASPRKDPVAAERTRCIGLIRTAGPDIENIIRAIEGTT